MLLKLFFQHLLVTVVVGVVVVVFTFVVETAVKSENINLKSQCVLN